MNKLIDIAFTGLAPAIWGSTFLVTTQFLPDGYPLTNAYLRALPAGLLLLLVTRSLPPLKWLPCLLTLGALNFSIFWWLLFEAAYRLPGGVAATIGAIQPLMVYALAMSILGSRLNWWVFIAGLGGFVGVGLLVLTSDAAVDEIGVLAAIGGGASMALGTVLSKLWQLPVSPLSFASWQLIAGGLLIIPFALAFEPPLPVLTTANISGYVYLAVLGGAMTYVFWFRGIAKLGPAVVTTLGFLSPISAVLLGWFFLAQDMSVGQIIGIGLVLLSVLTALRAQNLNSSSCTQGNCGNPPLASTTAADK